MCVLLLISGGLLLKLIPKRNANKLDSFRKNIHTDKNIFVCIYKFRIVDNYLQYVYVKISNKSKAVVRVRFPQL